MSDEFDIEPIPGLPERLPAGETILWQGAPAWRQVARHALHVRKIAFYFAVLTVWNGVSALQAGKSIGAAAISASWGVGMGLAACALLAGFAWLVGRSTVYTVTNRRVVMRFGIALPMTVNYPYALVQAANLRLHADGTGEIPLAMRRGSKLSYLVLWPHVRPWKFGNPQPMMRAVPEAERVARILGRALAAAAEQPATATPTLDLPSQAAIAKQAAAAA
jgi:hypothetical protein